MQGFASVDFHKTLQRQALAVDKLQKSQLAGHHHDLLKSPTSLIQRLVRQEFLAVRPH